MKQPDKTDADPEDDFARMAAEATNDATPEKSLHDSSEVEKDKRNRPKAKQRG